ncbi:MAG: transcription-repair coupling factor [Clostridiales bacterium]|nr:transcription-repair coupling factor [Clostridiales bacterium]
MNILHKIIAQDKEYAQILSTVEEQLEHKPHPILVSGLSGGAVDIFYRAFVSDLREKYRRPVLIIVGDDKDGASIARNLNEDGVLALQYPQRDFVFYNISASHEFEHERLSVLSALLSGEAEAVVTTPDALLQYTMPPQVLSASRFLIMMGEERDPDNLISTLIRMGYVRVELVDAPGQFARRGGIVDIFPVGNSSAKKNQPALPVRIEFFGDEIDRMGVFDVESQRIIENIREAEILPARELIYDREAAETVRRAIKAQLSKAKDAAARKALEEELAAVDGGQELKFIDKYITAVYPERSALTDYFDLIGPSVCIIGGTTAVNERREAFHWHMGESITELLDAGTIASKYCDYAKSHTDFEEFLSGKATVHVNTFAVKLPERRLGGIFSFRSRQTVSYAGNYRLMLEDIEGFTKGGYRRIIVCESEHEAKNIAEMLSADNINAVVSTDDAADLWQNLRQDMPLSVTLIITGRIESGFELLTPKIAVMSVLQGEGDRSRRIKGLKRKGASKKTAGQKIMSYADLEIGDYVVHTAYGIGMYMGIENLIIDGVSRDYIKINYAGSDKLFLPVDQLDLVSKFIGARSEDGQVKLSKMGGADWQRAKARAKSAVRDMAKELIALYAERMRKSGFAFLPDDDMQREFEELFDYDETDSQLEAVEDIKRDMQRPVPMDRLLCGDVGFGKTEVAFRAAFKAILSGKQVAFLVPTTILALQHYQTAVSRMRRFPVKIEMLSRFRSPKQQAEILRRLRRGDIDMIIGTHRLVSKDVVFKNLGLLIVDEEQRFGVAQKEKIKQMATNIDVLTLTATPIPRTLNMAMSGIRDMSVLDEAPGDRLPVQTYVLEHDPVIINEAIRKELRRGGQVFYLYNRVETIDIVASRMARAFPDARIAVAHGQMDRERIEEIWQGLVDGELDILVCTTIIETGVDVPNANTLIIENADRLGLAQLHQLRGRVGRSSRRAYAYFTYRMGKSLSEIAEKRLSAIREYAEFGAGFRIALRDLEIRGAGNLLGAEQHGHVDAVGYDLYIKLLNEAVLEERGEKVQPKIECKVDISVDAFIPESYVPSAPQRMELYKRIALIEKEEDMIDLSEEICDRYGDYPKPTDNLLKVALIRSMAAQCGVSRIEQREAEMRYVPQQIDINVWPELSLELSGSLRMIMANPPYITYKLKKGQNPISFSHQLFKKYIQIARGNK